MATRYSKLHAFASYRSAPGQRQGAPPRAAAEVRDARVAPQPGPELCRYHRLMIELALEL
eukprot:3243116-Pleurochrysis_carterae.AAC.1